jgi:hypothetical protein
MRGVVGMLPWVVVLAIAGAAIWLLLERQVVLGTWVLAALILGHGLVHGLYLVPPPDPPAGRPGPRWPFDLGRSWLVALTGARRGRRVAGLLVGVVVVASILAALATVGILPVAWWSVLLVLAAVASLVLLVLAFDPQLLLGIGIDAALLLVVLTGSWAPAGA